MIGNQTMGMDKEISNYRRDTEDKLKERVRYIVIIRDALIWLYSWWLLANYLLDQLKRVSMIG